MKNVINYYYSLTPNDIYQKNQNFYFDYQGFKYYFMLYNNELGDLSKVYEMHVALLNNGIYVHQIMLNKESQIITIVDGSFYILLKTNFFNHDITFNDMIEFNRKVVNFNEKDQNIGWGKMWEEKNDYLEYQLNKLGYKYPLIRQSFSYYIGLGETGIQIVNYLNKTNLIKCVSHKRIGNDLFELYNPLNLILDVRVRDVAEYFKESFFKGHDIVNELNYYLTYERLNHNECILFLARLLYPTYYFDLYEKVIEGKFNEEELEKIISKANDFESIIRLVYQFCKSIHPAFLVDWLES